MRYYALYDENNKLTAIGTGDDGVEITEEEYSSLLSEIREKAGWENKLYSGEITPDEIPIQWRAEIERAVNERIAAYGKANEQEIGADEALAIILGGETA